MCCIVTCGALTMATMVCCWGVVGGGAVIGSSLASSMGKAVYQLLVVMCAAVVSVLQGILRSFQCLPCLIQLPFPMCVHAFVVIVSVFRMRPG
jgi:hypothetical protein